jgi:excisionase family DNA binding protein
VPNRNPTQASPTAAHPDPEQKFSRPEAAHYLGLSPRTLESWAARGGGPRHLKLGARVLYRRRDLDAFAEAGERGAPPSEPGRAA